MRIKSLLSAALAGVMLLGLASCAKKPEVAEDPNKRPDGKVYVEKKVELDFDEDIYSMTKLPDGNFLGFSTVYSEADNTFRLTTVVFDRDGKVVNTTRILPEQINSGINYFKMGFDGEMYALEGRYSDIADGEGGGGGPVPQPMPVPMSTPIPLSSEGTVEEAAADGLGIVQVALTGGETDEADKTDDEAGDEIEPGTVPAQEPEPGVTLPRPNLPDEGVARRTPDFYVHHFDYSGKLVGSVKLEVPASESGEEYFVSSLDIDEQGRIFTAGGRGEIMRFGPSGAYEKTYAFESVGRFMLLPQGQAFMSSYDDEGETFTRLTLESGETMFSIGGDTYYDTVVYNPVDGKLYGKANTIIKRINDDGTTDDVLFLSDFSLMSPLFNLRDFTMDESESFYFVIMRNIGLYEQLAYELANAQSETPQPYPTMPCELSILELVDAAQVPAKTEITISVMYQDAAIMQAASLFGSLNPDIKVKVREIVPSDTIDRNDENGYDTYIKKVNTEILTGKAADIIALSNLPYEKYQEKNILLNLSDLIKNDPDMTDDNYFMNIIRAYETNGKQFVLPKTFQPNYLRARENMGVPEGGFALGQFISFCDSLPPEKVILSYNSPENMFYTLFMENINYFLDTREKKARLDSQEFIDLLDACKRLGGRGAAPPSGEDYDPEAWERYNQYLNENMVFQADTLYDYRRQAQSGVLIPIPGVEGPSTAFYGYDIYGINRSTKQKDACWKFLKFLIGEDYLKNTSGGGITINKKVNKTVANYLIQIDKVNYSGASRDKMIAPGGEVFTQSALTQAMVDEVNAVLAKLDTPIVVDYRLTDMMLEEVTDFFEGKRTAQETAASLQSRMNLYLSE